MRYYVTADVHGYFTQLKTALTDLGFFEDPEPHRLILCGDCFDRGSEALAMQEFLLELIARDQLILIRGNHEDLALQLLNGWHRGSHFQYHHHTNGTIDTVCRLTGFSKEELLNFPNEVGRAFLKCPYIQNILPATVDFFETKRYLFVHGWIPCSVSYGADGETHYDNLADWREATPAQWDKARWINGMEAAHNGILVPEKTVVCGHWHCSFGHSRYENDGGEFDHAPNFNPYYGKGIIALDACTPVSHKVNCILLED